jgi:hypothetical protein
VVQITGAGQHLLLEFRKPIYMSKKEHTKRRLTRKEQRGSSKAKQVEKTTGTGLLSAIVVAVVSFILVYIFIPEPEKALAKTKALLIFGALVVAFFTFIIKQYETDGKIRLLAKTLFFTLFLLNLIIPFIQSLETNPPIELATGWVLFQQFTFVPAIIFGLLALWVHRERIDVALQEFAPVADAEIGKSNPVKTFFTQTPWHYFAALAGVVVIAAAFNFYQLDYFDFYEDEYQVIRAAKGIQEQGLSYLDEGYDRAWIHSWMIAQVYKVAGQSEWTSRFLSALFGTLFIGMSALVFNFFFKNKYLGIATAFVIILDARIMELFRYTRMYALLIPAFLLLFYFVYRALTEEKTIKFLGKAVSGFVGRFLNFHYIFIGLALAFLFLNYKVHINSMIILLFSFLFTIYLAITKREKKYFILGSIGLVLLPFIPAFRWADRLTMFEGRNTVYYNYLTSFPFSQPANLIVLITGLAFLFLSSHKLLRDKIVFLYITFITTLLLFVFIIIYRGFDFRFISHVSPLVTAFVVFLSFLFAKVLFTRKAVQWSIIALIIASAGMHFSDKYSRVYEKHPWGPFYSIAYQTIKDNFDVEKDVVLVEYWRHYYMSKEELGGNAKVKGGVLRKGNESFKNFIDTIQTHKRGWITWPTHKSHRMQPEAVSYIQRNFKQHHGFQKDDRGVEVYYFDESMIEGTEAFARANQGVFNTNVYLDFAAPFSVSFWVQSNTDNPGLPFILRNDSDEGINLLADEKGLSFQATAKGLSLETGVLFDQSMHHVTWYYSGGQTGDETGLYIDGKKQSPQQLSTTMKGMAKFLVSGAFKGQVRDLRFYGFPLTEKANTAIYNKGTITTEPNLFDGERYFRTRKHFVAKAP